MVLVQLHLACKICSIQKKNGPSDVTVTRVFIMRCIKNTPSSCYDILFIRISSLTNIQLNQLRHKEML